MVLCSISMNLYIGKLQNAILEEGQEIINTVDPLLPASSLIAQNIEDHIIPVIRKTEDKNLEWLPDDFGWFSSESLQKRTRTAHRFEQNNIEFRKLSDLSFYILKYVNLLMWFPIVLAGLWMYQDLQKGKYKLVTVLCLTAALLVNTYSHQILNTIWPL